jgi:hypothetical protein
LEATRVKITARIVHNNTESTFTGFDDQSSAEFFTAKAFEWTQGRRDGTFVCQADNGTMHVSFRDITGFSVEVSA